MATSFGQTGNLYRYADSSIQFTLRTGDSDPSAWGLKVLFGPFGISSSTTIPTATLSVTPTVSGTTITAPITRAQLTTTLTGNQYPVALWRTDAGSEKPLATGTVSITTVPTPQD